MKDFIETLRERHSIIKTRDFKNRKERELLNRAVADGEIIKIKNGLYCFYEYLYELYYDINSVIPKGVLCLWNAWYVHDLCDIIPHNINVAVPNGTKVMLKNKNIPYVIHYRYKDNYDFGIIDYERSGCNFKIYNLERCVCDAFRFRNKIGMDTTQEVFDSYMMREDKDLDKLAIYAKKMNLYNVIKKYIFENYGQYYI